MKTITIKNFVHTLDSNEPLIIIIENEPSIVDINSATEECILYFNEKIKILDNNPAFRNAPDWVMWYDEAVTFCEAYTIARRNNYRLNWDSKSTGKPTARYYLYWNEYEITPSVEKKVEEPRYPIWINSKHKRVTNKSPYRMIADCWRLYDGEWTIHEARYFAKMNNSTLVWIEDPK